MKKLVKLKVILLAFIIIFTSKSLSADLILPLPKPAVDQEIKIKTAKKKEIYPQKKPETKIKQITSEEEISKIEEKFEGEIAIYPQKKPVIVKKVIDKAVAKSKVLSKKDFKLAKSTFAAIDKKKWKTALKLSKKARDKTLYDLVNYLYLIKPSNAASFYDYVSFIKSKPEYPRVNRLKYLAEHKINLNTNVPRRIMQWFGEKDPLSEFGKIKLGEIYILQGNKDKGARLIKEGWIRAKLSKSDLRYLRKKYKKNNNCFGLYKKS